MIDQALAAAVQPTSLSALTGAISAGFSGVQAPALTPALATPAGAPPVAFHGPVTIQTDDPRRFVEIAARLATEAAGWRPRVRDQLLRSTLCDGRGIARKIESAYRQAWRTWCGRPPTSK